MPFSGKFSDRPLFPSPSLFFEYFANIYYLDLQLKLDTQKDEVQKLREQIVRRDELVVQLQHQLQSLQEENARQRNTLNSLSEPDQLRLYQDARFIREFKARQQYLHEIEMAAQCVVDVFSYGVLCCHSLHSLILSF